MASYRVKLLGRSGINRPDKGQGTVQGNRVSWQSGFVQRAGTGRKLCFKNAAKQHVVVSF